MKEELSKFQFYLLKLYADSNLADLFMEESTRQTGRFSPTSNYAPCNEKPSQRSRAVILIAACESRRPHRRDTEWDFPRSTPSHCTKPGLNTDP
jgi:hypothetical protein